MATTAETAAAALNLPKQFYGTMVSLVDGMVDIFDDDEPLAQKRAFLATMADNDGAHQFMIAQWWTECKPHLEMIDGKDRKVFKMMAESPFVGDLDLYGKWTDKRFRKSRDTMWKYIQNMTQMAQVHAGEFNPENGAAEATILRLGDKLGIKYNEETGEATFKPDQLESVVKSMVTNPSSDDFADLMSIGQTYAGAMGLTPEMLASMQTDLSASMAPQAAAKPKKKKAAAAKRK